MNQLPKHYLFFISCSKFSAEQYGIVQPLPDLKLQKFSIS